MIQTMNNYPGYYEEDTFDESEEYDPARELKRINDVFVRALYKPETLERLASFSRSVRRESSENGGLSGFSSAKRSRSSGEYETRPRKRKQETNFRSVSEEPPIPLEYQKMKAEIFAKPREELEMDIKRFNERLKPIAGRIGLGQNGHVEVSTMKKRREKWSDREMCTLWGAISLHGNNWTAISKIVPGRNYFQCKDKGRRELCGRGWATGRKKSEGDEAMLHAQAIAQMELQAYFKSKASELGFDNRTSAKFS